MEDFFYYCQIHNEGIESMEKRKVSSNIPLSEIPSLMRALGHYPTEQEVYSLKQKAALNLRTVITVNCVLFTR